MRPLVRVIAAIALPLLVPAIICGILWLLPGDPASIICPPELCGQESTDSLAEQWELHKGPMHFYQHWITNALTGDLGRSWRVYQGRDITGILLEDKYLANTTFLILFSFVPVVCATVFTVVGAIPAVLDRLWNAMGLAPAVILALFAAAFVTITYGPASFDGWPGWLRLILGALVLGLADGMLNGAIVGTRQVFDDETKQRYVQMAILRGEGELSNALPNVLPSLVGQLRARILLMLSGAVIVEVVLQIAGVGSLLWDGTLMQDFGVVLAAAFVFAVFSGLLLLAQAMSEVALNIWVRRSPEVPE